VFVFFALNSDFDLSTFEVENYYLKLLILRADV